MAKKRPPRGPSKNVMKDLKGPNFVHKKKELNSDEAEAQIREFEEKDKEERLGRRVDENSAGWPSSKHSTEEGPGGLQSQATLESASRYYSSRGTKSEKDAYDYRWKKDQPRDKGRVESRGIFKQRAKMQGKEKQREELLSVEEYDQQEEVFYEMVELKKSKADFGERLFVEAKGFGGVTREFLGIEIEDEKEQERFDTRLEALQRYEEVREAFTDVIEMLKEVFDTHQDALRDKLDYGFKDKNKSDQHVRSFLINCLVWFPSVYNSSLDNLTAGHEQKNPDISYRKVVRYAFDALHKNLGLNYRFDQNKLSSGDEVDIERMRIKIGQRIEQMFQVYIEKTMSDAA